ncbi:hypothetical protein AALP_AAs61459U000300 [Arabis alpina]|uniref:Helicase C-terminal domain-containing protein n=1 Tax=Arabis alpina TaxID=50452 RepID=A0A087G2P3_ARAAL|nr:hypothetical protein AALP_AAs61459U000300 [Arabis alpina]
MDVVNWFDRVKQEAINYTLAELGQWCAYKVAQSFLTALQSDERVNFQVDVKFQESYLSEVVSLLQCELVEGAVTEKAAAEVTNSENGNADDEMEEGELPDDHVVSGGEHVDEVIGAAMADGKVTPKVQSLIKLLLKYQHTADFRAIVFVERVVAALVLPKVFAALPSLGFIRCASMIGHNNSHEMKSSQMQDTISKFRDGHVTLLVATSVAEEGLDIRQCNVVMRFDLAKTVLAYIQSRGRARKPGSDYILMVERENVTHAAFLRNARNSEETLRKEAIERTDLSHLKDRSRLITIDSVPGTVYKVEKTGAMVSLNSAVGLVHFYCSQLPGDRYAILRPEFSMEKHENPGGHTEELVKTLRRLTKMMKVNMLPELLDIESSEFAVLFGNELDAEVLSMSMDLYVARPMITKASLAFGGSLDVTESQLSSLKKYHVRLMSIVLDVDVEPSTTPWDPAKA